MRKVLIFIVLTSILGCKKNDENNNKLNSSNFLITELHSGVKGYLISTFFIGSTGYAVGFNGLIIKTINSGLSWDSLSSGTKYNLHSVYFTDVNTGYVVGEFGTIIKTIDGGTTWNHLQSYGSYLSSIFFTDTNTGYIIGSLNGIILKTTNAGASWSILNSSKKDFCSIYFVDSSIGFVTGNNPGQIFKTQNSGKTWDSLSIGTNNSIFSIFFTDLNNGIAVGDSVSNSSLIIKGVILKTTDEGKSWISLNTPITPNHSQLYTSVFFIDKNTGFITGNAGYLSFTNDGGNSWVPLSSGTNNQLQSLYFPNNTTGYVVGIGGTILKIQIK